MKLLNRIFLHRKGRFFVPPGHFHSPIVNVEELYASGWSDAAGKTLPEVDLRYPEQLALFRRLAEHFAGFPVQQNPRFRHPNAFISLGDATILSAFIRTFRPKRIIEAGSGFSSAAMLDTIEAAELDTKCTFIEPHPARLHALLRPEDGRLAEIIERPVQAVDLSIFEALEQDDILYLDTTHVVKTGSDVVHELFNILPRLRSGVIIHFHDVFHGFEYPKPWVLDDNRSWNEIYLLRAFLANNTRYRIELLANSLVKAHPAEMREIAPSFRVDGGALWLRKTG